MAFADATFDCVVAQFVITLVANPEQVLSECRRVVKPGGRIILVNHLYSEKGVAAAVERWAAQRTRALGLRPEFPFARLQAWAQTSNDAILVERRKVAPFRDLYPGLFRTSGSVGGVSCHHAVTGLRLPACAWNLRMSEECPERRFRTLFISDVHLGARGSQAERLLDFLRTP